MIRPDALALEPDIDDPGTPTREWTGKIYRSGSDETVVDFSIDKGMSILADIIERGCSVTAEMRALHAHADAVTRINHELTLERARLEAEVDRLRDEIATLRSSNPCFGVIAAARGER